MKERLAAGEKFSAARERLNALRAKAVDDQSLARARERLAAAEQELAAARRARESDRYRAATMPTEEEDADAEVVTAKQIETMGEQLVGKRFRLIDARFLEANSKLLEVLQDIADQDVLSTRIGFASVDFNGTIFSNAVANKQKFGKLLTTLPADTPIEVTGTVVAILMLTPRSKIYMLGHCNVKVRQEQPQRAKDPTKRA